MRQGLQSDIHPWIADIRKLMHDIISRGNNVTLCWIPSHSSIEGNDSADSAAREAAKLTPELGCTVPPSDLLSLTKASSVHYATLELQQYTLLGKGKKYMDKAGAFSNKPWFIHSGIDRKRITLCNRIKAGHTRTKSHLVRMNILQDDSCSYCDQTSETLEHLLWSCPKFSKLRSGLYRDLSKLNVTADTDVINLFNAAPINILLRITSFIIQNQIVI